MNSPKIPGSLAFRAVLVALAVGCAADAALAQRPRFRRPDGAGGRPQPQQAEPEAPAEEKKVESWTAIRGGDVYLGDGTLLRRATVLIGDDKIHAVGHEVEIPEDATILEAEGKVVAPGFCIVKASGFGAPRSGEDVRDGMNPFDPTIKMGLAAGITSFLWQNGSGNDKPGGNSSLVKLAYGDLEGMVGPSDSVKTMRVPLNPQQMKTFRDLVKQAREHQDAVREAAKDDKKPAPKPPRGTEDILKILDGETRLWISMGGGSRMFRGGGDGGGDDTTEIRQAMEIASLLGRGVVLDDPVCAWVIADEVAATGSMAIVNPRNRVPSREGFEDSTGSNIAQAAILHDVGVPVAVTAPGGRFGGSGVGTGGILGQDLNTPHVDAAFAVRGGMPNRQALRTLTLDAARIMGVEARVGSLEVGKDADVLILDGDPLHYKTFVDTALVNGKVAYVRAEEPYYRHIRR